MEERLYNFGMIGLGTMGRNFLLNMADHGFAVAGFDLDASKCTLLESTATKNTIAKGFQELVAMIASLEKPRKIMMLVPAGNPVDQVISNLLPLIETGDIIIDGGNSHYTDTLRRIQSLEAKGIHFMGVGISGGEEGARYGPSIMPGGDEAAWKMVQPLLEAVSAKVNGDPCVAYMGKNAAGHYVKMVHNGIEYAIMQMISEVYDFLKKKVGLDNTEMSNIFQQWDSGEMKSFLLEITADIFQVKDTETSHFLVDMVLDQAGSKGTGKWTSQDAMDLPVSIPSIDVAVAMRDLSDVKEERMQAAKLYPRKGRKISSQKEAMIRDTQNALYFSLVLAYTQGLSMLYKASSVLQMNIPLDDVVKIWRGGCIIRSNFLDIFYTIYKSRKGNISNILLDKAIAKRLKKQVPGTRRFLRTALQAGISTSGISSAINYFDAFTQEKMPVNLIQAQRDYFGAHTYLRNDKSGIYHSEWKPLSTPGIHE
ncbi:MAG: NADP-dependent phosphogluconate dehydrogenase [Bacteroidetes bacterium]|nr:NADP-dependent phosphogluconate dehydrogenase [Bacteroidota bacterium]